MVGRGEFVLVSYTGWELETGKVFETTSREVAEKEGIFRDGYDYGPKVVVVGSGHLIPGLEEALLDMDEKDEKEVVIPPEKAFGIRDAKKIVVYKVSEFRKRGLYPKQGMRLRINGRWGTVISSGGGRVRIDFNHPLAGKTLQYRIKVEKIVRDIEEQIGGIIELHFPKKDLLKTSVEGDTVRIEIPVIRENFLEWEVAKRVVASEILLYIKKVGKVEYVETYKREDTLKSGLEEGNQAWPRATA